jgi:hypothetical protein
MWRYKQPSARSPSDLISTIWRSDPALQAYPRIGGSPHYTLVFLLLWLALRPVINNQNKTSILTLTALLIGHGLDIS